MRVYRSAPLSQWIRVESFDSAEQCQQGLLDNIKGNRHAAELAGECAATPGPCNTPFSIAPSLPNASPPTTRVSRKNEPAAESGTGSSNSLRSANQSPHFAYILERAENSARNAAFFPPETHRREPAHAGFARLNPTKVLSDLWRRPQRREATASSNRARLGKAGLKRGGHGDETIRRPEGPFAR